MTYDENMLSNKRILNKSIKVGLPDRTQIYVKMIGDITLSDRLVLFDFLLVKGFKHNLLSISRLIKQTGVQVNFTRSGCSFQDPSSLC